MTLAVAAAFLTLNASADPLHLNHHSDLKFETLDSISEHSGNDGHSFNHSEDFDTAWFSYTGSWGFGDRADSDSDLSSWGGGSNTGGGNSAWHSGSFFANLSSVGADCGPGPVSVPDGSSTMVLLGSGLAMLLAFGRRFISPV